MDNNFNTMEQSGDNFSSLKALLNENPTKYDIPKIEKAYIFAEKLHSGQYRVSGEPYIIHPVAVAEIVYSLGLDTDSICAALLHDTVEDCSVSLEAIRKEFGPTIEMLVDGLTKLVKIPFDDKEEEHMENLRKMFLAMSRTYELYSSSSAIAFTICAHSVSDAIRSAATSRTKQCRYMHRLRTASVCRE